MTMDSPLRGGASAPLRLDKFIIAPFMVYYICTNQQANLYRGDCPNVNGKYYPKPRQDDCRIYRGV